MAGPLLAYLRDWLGTSRLQYLHPPQEWEGGWETYTYRFQLQDTGRLAPELTRPLVARIYASPEGLPRARREFLIQCHLARRDYPVVEPLRLEEASRYFGGPFLIQPEVRGRTLLQEMVQRPWKIFTKPVPMAALHARLHRLPPRDFPAPAGPLVERRLAEMAEMIERYDLAGLEPGLAWLTANRPAPPAAPSIVHLDFHPLNLIHDRGGSLVVLDWTEADLGDPHADVATTLMLMACMPAGAVTLRARWSIAAGRFFFRRWYLRAYRWRSGLDSAKLAYYRAWAAFGRLCRYGAWLQAGPHVTGSKPSSVRHLTTAHVRTIEGYFRRWSGIPVRLARSRREEMPVPASVPG